MNNVTAVLINTRGNPEKLTMTVLALAGLAIRPKLLKFGFRIDDDDIPTKQAIARLHSQGIVGVVTTGGRPQSMGAETNRLAQSIDADIYHVLNDDVIPVTYGWDLPAFVRAKEEPAFVSCWTLQPSPTAPDYPVVSRAWFEAAGRKLFTENYAYWFDDMDLSNRYLMLTGKLMKQLPMALVARKGKTQRMRDFDFWYTVYRADTSTRIDWTQSTATNLGLTLDIRTARANWIIACSRMDQDWYAAKRRVNVDKILGDTSSPDPAYLAIKRRAEQLILNSPVFKAA